VSLLDRRSTQQFEPRNRIKQEHWFPTWQVQPRWNSVAQFLEADQQGLRKLPSIMEPDEQKQGHPRTGDLPIYPWQ
jgi:hypothetical protein